MMIQLKGGVQIRNPADEPRKIRNASRRWHDIAVPMLPSSDGEIQPGTYVQYRTYSHHYNEDEVSIGDEVTLFNSLEDLYDELNGQWGRITGLRITSFDEVSEDEQIKLALAIGEEEALALVDREHISAKELMDHTEALGRSEIRKAGGQILVFWFEPMFLGFLNWDDHYEVLDDISHLKSTNS